MEHCNFIVVVCPTCGKRDTETCGVYAMAGGFRGITDECEECRERRKKREAKTPITHADGLAASDNTVRRDVWRVARV